MTGSDRQVIHAAALALPGRGILSPATIVLEGSIVLAVGPRDEVAVPADVRVRVFDDLLLMPALVNAHAHLDLTHIGPQPFGGSFVGWIEMIRSRRVTGEELAASVSRGIEFARRGGTGLIGDIASPAVLQQQIPGVQFREVFGIGSGQANAIVSMSKLLAEQPHDVSRPPLGLQPHAPYSCGPEVYSFASEQPVVRSTHLAETLEELEFAATATGPLAEMLRTFGVWNDAIEPLGAHPIDALATSLSRGRWLLAHLNYVEDHHLPLLAAWNNAVAYCPRASAYFGHPHGGWPAHRYREMLEIGINVALGTDSIVCLDTPDRISVLDEMRLLYQRDATDPMLLLTMGTINGARALGFDPAMVTLQPGPTLGLIGLSLADSSAGGEEAWRQVLMNDDAPRWIAGPFGAQQEQ